MSFLKKNLKRRTDYARDSERGGGMSLLDLIDAKEIKKLDIRPFRKLYNDLAKGMVFYEVKTTVDKVRKRYDVEILREYVVIDNNQGKVTTICIHHCEDYVVSQRTDWKKRISKQFKNYKTPKELEQLYYLAIPLFHDFMGECRISERKPFNELKFELEFFKTTKEEE